MNSLLHSILDRLLVELDIRFSIPTTRLRRAIADKWLLHETSVRMAQGRAMSRSAKEYAQLALSAVAQEDHIGEIGAWIAGEFGTHQQVEDEAAEDFTAAADREWSDSLAGEDVPTYH